jgi:hypothetical protein
MLTFRSREDLDGEQSGRKMERKMTVAMFEGVKWRNKCVI